jgi:hypothetical protein
MITYPFTYNFKGYTIELIVANGRKWTTIKVSGFTGKPYLSLLFNVGWKSPGLEEKILVLYCQMFEMYENVPLQEPVFTTNIKVTNQNGEFDRFFSIRMDGTEQLQQVLNAFLHAFGSDDKKNDELAYKVFNSYATSKGIENPFGLRLISFIPTGMNPKDEWESSIVEPLDYDISVTDETGAGNDGAITITITNQQTGKTPEFSVRTSDGTVIRDFGTSLTESNLSAGDYQVWSQYQDAYYLPDGTGGLIKMKGFKKTFTVSHAE